MLININAMAREQCSFYGLIGHNEMTCGMARGEGVGCEEVNYMGDFGKLQPRNDPYSNSYNPGWRNHPNFS